jgi:hypothetical protein
VRVRVTVLTETHPGTLGLGVEKELV